MYRYRHPKRVYENSVYQILIEYNMLLIFNRVSPVLISLVTQFCTLLNHTLSLYPCLYLHFFPHWTSRSILQEAYKKGDVLERDFVFRLEKGHTLAGSDTFLQNHQLCILFRFRLKHWKEQLWRQASRLDKHPFCIWWIHTFLQETVLDVLFVIVTIPGQMINRPSQNFAKKTSAHPVTSSSHRCFSRLWWYLPQGKQPGAPRTSGFSNGGGEGLLMGNARYISILSIPIIPLYFDGKIPHSTISSCAPWDDP